MTGRDRFHAFIERYLMGWFDPHDEAGRNGRIEAVRLRAVAQRIRIERVLADYEAADRVNRRDR